MLLLPHASRPVRVEFEDREPDQTLLTALEGFKSAATGGAANWGASVDAALIINLGKYRRYDYTSLRDLLRVVRNKKNHFREMPEALQGTMGPVPDGYYRQAGVGWAGRG
jgi:serine/threonine-protein kinase/endoribonuclease IRE1